MATPQQTTYPNAPIIEAIVEFRYVEALEDKAFDSLSSGLSKRLPDAQPLPHYDIRLDIDSGKIAQSEEKGLVRSNSDQTRLAVIRPKSLVCSVKAPYKDFQDFRHHVEFVWDTSNKVLGFRKLSRIGMRYINRIDLAVNENRIDYEKFLNLRINLPESFEPITSYNIEFTFEIPDIMAHSRIISTVKKDIVINHASFFLDIDIGRTFDLPQKKQDIFNLLQSMRVEKNRLFEQFITDEARGLFHAE